MINAVQAADKSDVGLLLLNSVLNLLCLYDVKTAWDTPIESRKVCIVALSSGYAFYFYMNHVSAFIFNVFHI